MGGVCASELGFGLGDDIEHRGVFAGQGQGQESPLHDKDRARGRQRSSSHGGAGNSSEKRLCDCLLVVQTHQQLRLQRVYAELSGDIGEEGTEAEAGAEAEGGLDDCDGAFAEGSEPASDTPRARSSSSSLATAAGWSGSSGSTRSTGSTHSSRSSRSSRNSRCCNTSAVSAFYGIEHPQGKEWSRVSASLRLQLDLLARYIERGEAPRTQREVEAEREVGARVEGRDGGEGGGRGG